VLLNNILKEKNELTIEGCAKLLSNFHLSKEVAEREIEVLWDNCLFGLDTSCRKEATRQALYELILKVCENSKEVTDIIIKKTLATIADKFRQIKIVYSTEVNQRSPSTGYAGLKNLGNICYMNSMIQQLYMNPTFRWLLMRIDDQKEAEWTVDPKGNPVDDNFLHQIQRIFGYLERTTRLDFIPSAFCVAYKPFGEPVNIMMQQDVQEFVSMFFDRLESGIKEHPLRRLVDNFYLGKNANLFSCHACNQTKKVEESFYSITLEVKNSKNLSESFNRYILGELINDFQCDFCNKKADVSKKARISKAPHNLIIHLQRIDLNFETFVNEKLTNKHEFPLDFNLYPYTLDYFEREQQNDPNLSKENPYFQYELSGIVCHIGNAENGHYISYIKNPEGKWLEFNDSFVNTFNPTNIEAECFGGSFTYDD
jgi:ubiquitin carboxyl-terminal hydrolase 34